MFTKLATMTWSSAEAQNESNVDSIRYAYLQDAISAGLTDENHVEISPTVTTRVWLDQASANAWSRFISNQARSIGATCDVVITDIV